MIESTTTTRVVNASQRFRRVANARKFNGGGV